MSSLEANFLYQLTNMELSHLITLIISMW